VATSIITLFFTPAPHYPSINGKMPTAIQMVQKLKLGGSSSGSSSGSGSSSNQSTLIEVAAGIGKGFEVLAQAVALGGQKRSHPESVTPATPAVSAARPRGNPATPQQQAVLVDETESAAKRRRQIAGLEKNLTALRAQRTANANSGMQDTAVPQVSLDKEILRYTTRMWDLQTHKDKDFFA
jgi:hypothetical protein